MNTLDIKVTEPGSSGSAIFSLRKATKFAIEFSKGRNFLPLSFSDEIMEEVEKKLVAKGVPIANARNLIYFDMVNDFGADIADETFRYIDLLNESFESRSAMLNSGMFEEVMKLITGRTSMRYDGANLDELMNDLIEEINEEGNEEKPEKSDLSDLWNGWGEE
jgi:hypothetical protein